MPFISNTELIKKEAKILSLEQQIETLKEGLGNKDEIIVHLTKRIESLQDALIAVRAPEVYRDMKADQAVDNSVNLKDLLEKHANATDMEKLWLQSLEEPAFKSADDMIEILNSAVMKPPTTKSFHENEES